MCLTPDLFRSKSRNLELNSVIGDRVYLLDRFVLIVDPRKHQIGRLCRKVWSEGTKDFAEQLDRHIPNDEERAVFAEAVRNDILNSDYHLYCLL